MKNFILVTICAIFLLSACANKTLITYERNKAGKLVPVSKVSVSYDTTPEMIQQLIMASNMQEINKLLRPIPPDSLKFYQHLNVGEIYKINGLYFVTRGYGRKDITVQKNQNNSSGGKKNNGGNITTASPEFTGSYRGNDGLYYLKEDEEQLVSFGQGAAEKIGHYLAGTGSRTQREFGQKLYLQKLERLAEALKK